jgi:glycosyltransferase involved in cell wall biosynthesis
MKTRLKGWLFVLPWSMDKIGGVNRVLDDLSREFNDSEIFKPYIMTSSWESKVPEIIEKDNYTEIRYRLRPFPKRLDMSFFIFLWFLPQTLLTLLKLYKKFNIQVVNFHFPNLFIVPFAMMKFVRNKERFIISFHGSDLTNIESTKFKKKFFWPFVFAQADKIVACSHGLMLDIKKEYASNKLCYIHNGVSSNFREITNEPNFNLPEQYILSVGTFENKKGQDLLIKAFRRVKQTKPELNLVLVGRKTDYLSSLKQLASDLNLESCIHFYEDIQPELIYGFYQNAKLFVSPSRSEPFGIVMLEAALFKLPVIATKTIGAKEIIDNSIDGVLVDLDSVDDKNRWAKRCIVK